MHKRGFTLIELLIVIAITAIIFALSAPFALNFYHTQLINEAQSNIVSALERARHNAILQKNDSNFGVHFESGKYVIFQGDAYDVNDVTNNEEYPVVSGITFTGETDIIFSKLSGITATTSTTTLTYKNFSRGILMDESGNISKTD